MQSTRKMLNGRRGEEDKSHIPVADHFELYRKSWRAFLLKKWLRRSRVAQKFNTDVRHTESEKEYKGILRRNSEIVWTQCIRTREYRIFVGTWNVAGVAPPWDLDLEEWLKLKEPCDIYVLGFQEIVRLSAGNVIGSQDTVPATEWDALIRKTLNTIPAHQTGHNGSYSAPPSPSYLSTSYSFSDTVTFSGGEVVEAKGKHLLTLDESIEINYNLLGKQGYKQVASKQMSGLFISVWVRSELWRHIHNLKVASVGCGLMGRLGNKGSISVSMSVHETSFCFVCTHLASGEKNGDELRRNSDFSEILNRTHFPSDSTLDLPQTILGHDRMIWLGDLNYRLALPDTDMWPLVEAQDWKTLLESDQLRMEQSAGRAFDGWREQSIDFAPTYKYAVESDHFAYKNKEGQKHRTPAWCDRILWQGKGLMQLSYERAEYKLSDHRPVAAIFVADVEDFSSPKVQRTMGLTTKVLRVEDLNPPDFEEYRKRY